MSTLGCWRRRSTDPPRPHRHRQHGPDAATAGHDICYIAPTGALHAIGAAGSAPAIPLNLVGDLGGGAAYLVMGVLAALHEARSTGRGQVVDAAIVDGTVHLLGIVHSLLADGRWSDERGTNLLDGGALFYAAYRTLDGEYMAVGALEPQFFETFVHLARRRRQAAPLRRFACGPGTCARPQA